jgi:hypothetical protein
VDDAIRVLLEAADDPVHAYEPPDLDWDALGKRLTELRQTVSQIARRRFEVDDEVQDATYFGDIEHLRRNETSNAWEQVLAVRFSNFGSLFTTLQGSEAEPLPDQVIAEVVQAVSYAGFHYVPFDVLGEPYTGRHPAFAGSTWWHRFFDYG